MGLLSTIFSFLILNSSFSIPQSAPPLARVEAVPFTGSASPGTPVTLEVAVTPRDGIHVYAPPQKQYIPISLTIGPIKGGRAGKVRFPPSAVRTFEGERVRVYDKAFSLAVPVTLQPGASGAAVRVSGTLRYQACDDVMCYRPVNVPVRWDLRLQ
jgi:DsbC/DsbD-like thiol-disulfide interchange protein